MESEARLSYLIQILKSRLPGGGTGERGGGAERGGDRQGRGKLELNIYLRSFFLSGPPLYLVFNNRHASPNYSRVCYCSVRKRTYAYVIRHDTLSGGYQTLQL